MNVPDILKRASDKCGFTRIRYIEKNIPTSLSNICVMVFFGDIRSSYILSAMLLKKYREQLRGSKYFILCTWPGYEGLFPYVDEVWTIRDESILKKFSLTSIGFDNISDVGVQFRRELNYWFEDLVGPEVFESFYNNGIQQEFWDKFNNVNRFLVSVPSSAALGEEFNIKLISKGGAKVFIHPCERVQTWQRGKLVPVKCPKDFWVGLIKSLLEAKLTPVVYQNFLSYNLSTECGDCIYTTERSIVKVLGAMRATGCVLDVFSGISRWAMAARTPFIAIDDRIRYNRQKEYEIDDLLSEKILPRYYIFSFSTIIEHGDQASWKVNLYDVLISKLVSFIAKLDREQWPSPVEKEEIVPYQSVRAQRLKKMGVKFIKVNRDLR